MKFRCLALASVVLLSLASLPLPTQAATADLIVTGTFPSNVSSEQSSATFVLELPATVTLGAAAKVTWSMEPPTFYTPDGKASDLSRQVFAHADITPLGRTASFTLTTDIAGKWDVRFTATIDQDRYSLAKTMYWEPNTTRALLASPTGFHLESQVPSVGADLQTVIRARAVWSGACEPWGCRNMQLSWVTSSGFPVGAPLSVSNGQWVQFPVSAFKYAAAGFVLRASWYAEPFDLVERSFVNFSSSVAIEIPFDLSQLPKSTVTWRWYIDGAAPTSGENGSFAWKEGPIVEDSFSTEISFTAWNSFPSTQDCVSGDYSLDWWHDTSAKWVTEEWRGVSQRSAYKYCRSEAPSAAPYVGGALWRINPYAASGKWSKGTYNYRIFDSRTQSAVAQFNVTFAPKSLDPNLLKLNVLVPRTIKYGQSVSVNVTTSPAVSGSCSFYLYHYRDVPLGSAKLHSGSAKLAVKMRWPSGTAGTKSLKVQCRAGKKSGTTVLWFVGVA